ncbi:hypothetical protein [Halobacillus sp. H74]|uniref:hypothetical protein n=1 Tax=Halobacillus sp. H74 TaxID=3457436 RepID=UPI003FCE634A
MNLLTEKQIARKSVPFREGRHLYFLLDNDQVVYIGQCSKTTPNLFAHKEKDFTDYYMLPVADDEDINLLHAEYIVQFMPVYNSGSLPPNSVYMNKYRMKKAFDVTGHELNRYIRKNKAKTVYQDFFIVKEVFGLHD